MSYEYKTYITGTTNGTTRCVSKHGHWDVEKAVKMARKVHRMVGDLTISHGVIDFSGKGRGGTDHQWTVDANDQITWVTE